MEQLFAIILHAIGGFSSASFYVPSHYIRQWSWQTYWIALGCVAWIIMPWIGAYCTCPHLGSLLSGIDDPTLIRTYFFGLLWGFGGLMAGLGLRYLGLALGQSICLGVSAIVGTLVPAILDHKTSMLIQTAPGRIISLGFLAGLAGIFCCGYAGMGKDRKLSEAAKKTSVKEFSLVKGLTMAIGGGVMSAFMAFAIREGAPIAEHAIASGTAKVFSNNPIFILALGGGFTTNFIYAMIVSARKHTFSDYYNISTRNILRRNYMLAILSGVMWYGQFFFYGMGTSKMGQYDFASWSLHMSGVIIFSNAWGLALKEWKGVPRRIMAALWTGIILLIASVALIGLGNYLGGA